MDKSLFPIQNKITMILFWLENKDKQELNSVLFLLSASNVRCTFLECISLHGIACVAAQADHPMCLWFKRIYEDYE